MGKIVSPNIPLQLTWDVLLTHFKRKLCSTESMLELKNQILDLNKGIMMLDEYTNAFTSKIELSP